MANEITGRPPSPRPEPRIVENEVDLRLRRAREEGRREISRVEETNAATISHVREQARQLAQKDRTELQEDADRGRKALDSERQAWAKRQQDVFERGAAAVERSKTEVEQNLTVINSTDHDALVAEQTHGREAERKIHSDYTAAVNDLRRKGESELQRQRDLDTARAHRLKNEDGAELKKLALAHGEALKEEEQHFGERHKANQEYYRQAIHRQSEEFAKAQGRGKAELARESAEQKGRLTDELNREKIATTKNLSRYHDQRDDPFYRMAQVTGRLAETSEHYKLTVRVPEHERENIKVKVHGDKMVIEGHRRFHDQSESEGRKIASENYQTFREVVPLEHPVRARDVRESYRDGVLTIKVPKA